MLSVTLHVPIKKHGLVHCFEICPFNATLCLLIW